MFTEETRPLVDPSSSQEEWIESLGAMLAAAEFENTWSVAGGTACRAVFLFDNGLRITWCGSGNGDAPELVQIWVDTTVNNQHATPFEASASGVCPIGADLSPEWNSPRKAWECYPDTSQMLLLLQEAAGIFGEPELGIPWGPIANSEFSEELIARLPEGTSGHAAFMDAVNAFDEDTVSELLDMFEENDCASSTPVFAAAVCSAIVQPSWAGGTPGKMTYCFGGDSWLPSGSGYERFLSMVEQIENMPDWVVVWDECCGTCASSSIKWARDSKGLGPDSHALVLFAQNAQYYWRPDGTIEWMLYGLDETERAVLVSAAESVGLTAVAAKSPYSETHVDLLVSN